MGKNKEKKRPKSDSESNSDSDSGPEDRNEPAAKKSKVAGAPVLKDEQGNTFFELDRNRRITVSEFKGKLYVNIREFYEKDGKKLPGKKGIALNAIQWNKMKSLIDDIDAEIQRKA